MASRYARQALADGLRPARGSFAGDVSAFRSVSGSVITPLAVFAAASQPHPPGGRIATRASFKQRDAISRRTPPRLLNPPQQSTELPQHYDFLFLFIAQDVVHNAEGIALTLKSTS
jgi:hypothetical protein